MIQTLRRKFIAIAMGSLLLVLLLIIGAVNGINFYRIDARANHLLQILTEHGGSFPRPEAGKEKPRRPVGGMDFQLSEETPFETRYFWAKADADGAVQQLDAGHIAAISEEQALEFARQALQKGKYTGYMGLYKYRVTRQDAETFLVFVDRSAQLEGALFFLLVSGVVGAAALLIMLLFVSIFSKWAIRPVAESLEKQKQFITDAGHEIKTPLSIISANADVLELQSGPSEWLDSIHGQVRRLNKLVGDLLTLSKMDESGPAPTPVRLDMSETVREAAEPFFALAETNGKKLTLDISPEVRIHGNAELLRKLVGILLDNAVKYAAAQTEIRLTLQEAGRYARLCIRNACDAVPEGDLRRLFDRFYRADRSRSRQTGGYGIGLSIADAIVRLHKGKISAHTEDDNFICFTALIPKT